MFKRIRSEGGFTLVELLVVLAILAILVAVAVPNLAGLTGGARETAGDTELDNVRSAMDTLMAENQAVTVTLREGTVTDAATVGPSTSVTYWQFDGDSAADFLRLRATSTGLYYWNITGTVSQYSY